MNFIDKNTHTQAVVLTQIRRDRRPGRCAYSTLHRSSSSNHTSNQQQQEPQQMKSAKSEQRHHHHHQQRQQQVPEVGVGESGERSASGSQHKQTNIQGADPEKHKRYRSQPFHLEVGIPYRNIS